MANRASSSRTWPTHFRLEEALRCIIYGEALHRHSISQSTFHAPGKIHSLSPWTKLDYSGKGSPWHRGQVGIKRIFPNNNPPGKILAFGRLIEIGGFRVEIEHINWPWPLIDQNANLNFFSTVLYIPHRHTTERIIRTLEHLGHLSSEKK